MDTLMACAGDFNSVGFVCLFVVHLTALFQ
jgi:hypothetical protein